MIDFADDDAHDDTLTRFAIFESFFFFLGRLGKKEKKFDNLKVMLSRKNSRLFFSLSYFDRNDTCLCNLNVVVIEC